MKKLAKGSEILINKVKHTVELVNINGFAVVINSTNGAKKIISI